MKGYATILVSLLVYILAASSFAVRIETMEKMSRSNLQDIKIHVSYVVGGTTRQALEKKHAHKQLIRVAPGGYFNPAANPLYNVDFTLVQGQVQSSYLFTRRRPVILFSPTRVARIAWPDPRTGGFERYADELEGLAGDDRCQKPERVLCRTIIGITKTTFSVFHVRATERRCRQYMEFLGYKRDQYIFMDGGDSTLPTAQMPSHILVFARTG